MSKCPDISVGKWITIENQDCVISKLYNAESQSGVGQVIFNKSKPTTHVFDWNGDTWFFPEQPDFGGYGRDSDPFVQQLKRGRYQD